MLQSRGPRSMPLLTELVPHRESFPINMALLTELPRAVRLRKLREERHVYSPVAIERPQAPLGAACGCFKAVNHVPCRSYGACAPSGTVSYRHGAPHGAFPEPHSTQNSEDLASPLTSC